MGSINRRDLKAYVRYDGSGRVVPGSLILRRNKPKVGTWQQVQGYECNSGGTQYQLSLLTEDTCSATVTYRSGVDNSNQTIELVDLNAEDYVIFCAVSGSVNVTDLFCDYDLAEIGQCGCSGEASPITFSGNTTTTTTTIAPDCFCYTISNETAGTLLYSYTDCGSEFVRAPINADVISIVCSSTVVTGDAGLIITGGITSCTNSEDCAV